jgi:hypothetical protein
MNELSALLFNGYKIGFELILINGLFTFLGLWFISRKTTDTVSELQPA